LGDLQDRARAKIHSLREQRRLEPPATVPHVYPVISAQEKERLQKQGLAKLRRVQAEMRCWNDLERRAADLEHPVAASDAAVTLSILNLQVDRRTRPSSQGEAITEKIYNLIQFIEDSSEPPME
jgi:hypothetical protein